MIKIKMPNDFVLAITYSCNSRCRMCNIWKKEAQPLLDLNEYKKLPEKIKDVNLTGGEPFLSPNLLEIIKILVSKNPRARIIISSNGFATELIRQKMIEILKIKPDIGIGISLDAIGEAHNQIRGIPGGYDKVLATIAMLKDLGIKNLRLAFTAGDYNINELKRVYKLSEDLGVQFTLAATHNAENYFNSVDNKITKINDFESEFSILIKNELSKLNLKNWLRAYFAYALLQFIKTGKRLLPNYSGQDSIFIDPLGDVYPSDVSGHVMGNLKEFESFEKLYYSKKSQEAIELESKNQNWMICTARSAIKKHPFNVFFWIIKSKFFGIRL
ncbi:radical SAM protein [Candidatus Falkowbacteria bacterium]|nr:radical SAM protein [Candidatus Falkowbacteria bacterium]